MVTMYETLTPYGFINYQCVKGVTKTPRSYYLIDDVYNYLRISESTYNQLLQDGSKYIENVRKGV